MTALKELVNKTKAKKSIFTCASSSNLSHKRSVSFWHRWYNWRAKLAPRLCRIGLQLECHNVPSLSFTCTTFHRIWHPAWANSETPASCDAVLPIISDKKSLLQNMEITHAPSECAHFSGSGRSHGAGHHQSSSSAREADRNYSPWENALVPWQNLPPWGWEAALLGSTTGRQVSVSFCFFLKKPAVLVCWVKIYRQGFKCIYVCFVPQNQRQRGVWYIRSLHDVRENSVPLSDPPGQVGEILYARGNKVWHNLAGRSSSSFFVFFFICVSFFWLKLNLFSMFSWWSIWRWNLMAL